MTDDLSVLRPILRKGVGFRRLFGEGVALVAETSKVNVLNETGCRFLELADGSRTLGEILASLEREYDAAPGDIQCEVTTFVDQARAAGLIELR